MSRTSTGSWKGEDCKTALEIFVWMAPTGRLTPEMEGRQTAREDLRFSGTVLWVVVISVVIGDIGFALVVFV